MTLVICEFRIYNLSLHTNLTFQLTAESTFT